MPDDLWQQGRQRRRRRRRTLVATAVFTVVAIVMAPAWLVRQTRFAVSGSDSVVLPRALAPPYYWQATIDASPNGPVKLMFMHGNNIGFEAGAVFIGADESYRVVVGDPSDLLGEVSADGRFVTHFHLGRWELLDTVSGKSRDLGLHSVFDRPLAWSPDGRRLLLKMSHDDEAIAYGDDGQPLNDPSKPDDIILYDVPTGKRTLLLTEHADNSSGGFSPDGQRVAFTTGYRDDPQTLHILDLTTAAEARKVPLTAQQRLLGPVAWLPDGRSVTLAAATGCPWFNCYSGPGRETQRWRLQRVDAATGEIADDPALRPGWPESLVGWRAGDPVTVDIPPDDNGRTVLLRLHADGSQETLLELPQGGRSLRVPREVIKRRTSAAQPSRRRSYRRRAGRMRACW